MGAPVKLYLNNLVNLCPEEHAQIVRKHANTIRAHRQAGTPDHAITLDGAPITPRVLREKLGMSSREITT